jgi:predicted TIM-barrel fold metal-dependent hydrolase
VYYDYAEGNAETIDRCRDTPFIIPAATIDPRRFHGGEEGLENLDEFDLLRVFPDIQGWPIDYAPFYKILEKASSCHLPLMAPAMGPGKPTQLTRVAKNQGVRVILNSVGYGTLSEALVLLQEYDDLYIGVDMLNTPDGIELVTDEAGPERLVFGSNYPATYFSGPLIAVQKAEVSPSDKRKILRDNALRILGIK